MADFANLDDREEAREVLLELALAHDPRGFPTPQVDNAMWAALVNKFPGLEGEVQQQADYVKAKEVGGFFGTLRNMSW